jgi:iron complex transport system permease protein
MALDTGSGPRGERGPGPLTTTSDSNRRGRLLLLVCGGVALVAAVAVLGVMLGPARLGAGEVLGALGRRLVGRGAGPHAWRETVVVDVRLPRVLIGLCVGGGLALAGATLQALFRNPLADPGVLGISTGASLGAVLTIYGGLAARAVWVLPLGAFAGAVGDAALVFGIAGRRGRGRVFATTLLLVGVALGALNASLATFVLSLSLSKYEAGRQIVYWLLGGLDGRTWDHLWLGGPAILIGALYIAAHARELDAMLLGELGAQSVGVDVPRVRARLILAVALVVGATVAVAGPIGFVGLLVPHLVRLLGGAAHRAVLPLAFLAGGAFVVGADLLARTVLAPAEIPVGVVTAALGAPFFLALLVRRGAEVTGT